MKRTVITPILILSGLMVSIALMAGSGIFSPLIRFVHGSTITWLQAGACLVFTLAGFAASYCLLNLLCGYFVPRMDSCSDKNKGRWSHGKSP
ncbi:MAG TPA: hypothetical protein EYP57_02380 [Thermodesulfobacteriaceae bacterium]|nr:hypothetical protein [Thermodesulfobacteriaceae bacterium]